MDKIKKIDIAENRVQEELKDMVDKDRFYNFIQQIDGIHKSINKLKSEVSSYLGIKSVHLFWVYELSAYPDGLTAAELAAKTMVSRSLVSRELEELKKGGYIDVYETGRGVRKNYNSRIVLTDKGKAIARYVEKEGVLVQDEVSADISAKELVIFYGTLAKLQKRLFAITQDKDKSDEI